MPVCMCARKSERRVSVSEYMCVSMHLLANVKISIPTVCFLKFNLYLWFHFSGMFLAFVYSCVCVCVWVE